MATEFGIYKCEVCGNIVEVLHAGDGVLVCCNKDMVLMKEKTSEEEGEEKHVPVIIDQKIVRVGSVPHPMEAEHYIEWIEASDGLGHSAKFFLKPGDKPEVEFEFEVEHARAYCNVHNLWTS